MNVNPSTAMKNGEENLFANPPRINVISKESYEKRVREVFELLYETLARSFGPYGAPTIIYNYPFSHVTKDGFTIMKNLSMDSSEQLVDQSIANAVSDICGRLNYQVGDGTTSAVVATYSIYNNYIKNKNFFENRMIMPRDVIAAFEDVKTKVSDKLLECVETIHTEDMDELYSKIYKVVYISSNGNKYFAEMIANLYKEIGYPGINCKLAEGGETKGYIINGYQFDVSLMDRLYINSDDDSLQIENGADIIIFQTKITKAIYENILKPLNEECRARGRKLIVCATTYDDVALGQTIRHDLTAEYKKNNSVNMVLCIYKSISDHTRKLANDFAMLCNTIIIDRQMKNLIETKLEDGVPINQIFNIDRRDDIPNLICAGLLPVYLDGEKQRMALYKNGREMVYNGKPITPLEMPDDAIRLGYAGKCTIGLKSSIFKDFYYNENMYNACVKEAETSLKEVEQQYARLGTFNIAVSQAQQRLYSLKLKMGLIEVSGDGELSQKLTKDAMDDAIKAAESAFKFGVIYGCNIDTIRSIETTISEYRDVKDQTKNDMFVKFAASAILFDGFVDVYRVVLDSAFNDTQYIRIPLNKSNEIDAVRYANEVIKAIENIEVLSTTFGRGFAAKSEISKDAVDAVKTAIEKYIKTDIFEDIDEDIIKSVSKYREGEYNGETLDDLILWSVDHMVDYMNDVVEKIDDGYAIRVRLIDFIISFSIVTRTVFDLGECKFNHSVINSMQTDAEILKATIELISLLIAGNQMVVTQKHNF